MKILKVSKIVSLLFLFFSPLILIPFSGCSTGKVLIKKPENLETLQDISFLKKSLEEKTDRLKSLKGIAKIKLKTDKKENSFNAVIVLKNPDFLRIEILGPFNQLIALISSDGKNIYQADLKNSRMIITPVSKSSSEKFFGIPLLPEEILEIITGSIKTNINNNIEVKFDKDNKIYVLTQTSVSDNLIKKYLINMLNLDTLRIDASDKDGNSVYEADYSDYQETGNCSVPKKIVCNYHLKNILIDINFKDISLNTEAPLQLFSLENQKGFQIIYQE